jgi:glucose/arabinose dehydrogenase
MTKRTKRWMLSATAALTWGAGMACTSDEGRNGPVGAGGAGTGGAGGAVGGSLGAGASSGASTGGVAATGGGGSGGASTTGGAGPAGGASAGQTAGGTAGAGGSPTVTGCRAPEPNTAPGNTCLGAPPPALALTTIVSGLNAPTFVTQAPGDPSRLYVVERRGRIVVVEDGVVAETPFLDIESIVRGPGPAQEQGLLGMAFEPDYAETGRFWVNYTGDIGVGDTVIASYQGTPGEPVDPSTGEVLTVVPQSSFFGNHNGGMIAFGPDGCLYVGMGDGGGSNDPDDHGQNAQTELGAMLRLDVENHPAAAPGNMTGPGIPGTLWSYGLRNPWRFSFDRVAGDLYIGDVGQGAWEEVDVEPRGVAGRNYGWNVMEGFACLVGTSCDQTGLTLPAVVQENGTHTAVIGGYVYRGSAIPGMASRYVYGDYGSRWIWSFVYAGEENGQPQICDEYRLESLVPSGDITSFGEDLAGELYVLTLQGTLYRIDPG